MTIEQSGVFSATLPGRYYHDPAIYAREQARIFGEHWTCVGRSERLAQAGDYLLAELGGESIIVVRGGDGALRAFLNVCRHRGARLCSAASGRLPGAIQCRYHAWTYALDGRLSGAPNALHLPGFERAEHGLHPVALEVWEGLIWLSLAEAPGSVEAQLAPGLSERFDSRARFDRYRLGELRSARTIEYTVHANWKIIVENYTECYHCAPLHPEFVRLIPDFKTARPYSGPGYEGTPLAEDVAAFTIDGHGGGPRLPGLLPEDDRLYYGFTLPTNLMISLLPDHAVVHTVHPLAPDCTRVVCDWLFDATAIAEPDFDPDGAVAIFDLVNRQDWEVCALTQQGVGSRAYRDGGVYVPSEHELRLFNDWVLAELGEM